MPYDANGSYTNTGTGNSYVGNYGNLPAGFSNAGRGTDSAYTRQVQPNELTSYQLQGLLASNSPYIQQARRGAVNAANGRGLLNSSIAAGNAQGAAIQAALPIAQQNAQAYGTAAGQNQEYLNQILNTRMNNQSAANTAQIGANASMHNARLQYDLGLRNLDYQGTQAGLNRGFQDYMARQQQQDWLRQGAFNLGSNMLQSNNSFTQNAYLQGMNNPFAISNPDAFQGYLDRATQGANSYYDNLFGFASNAGQPTSNWYENTGYYTSPYGGTQGNYNYSPNQYSGYYGGSYQQQPYSYYPQSGYNAQPSIKFTFSKIQF